MIDIIGKPLENLNLNKQKKGLDDIDLWAINLGQCKKRLNAIVPQNFKSKKMPAHTRN